MEFTGACIKHLSQSAKDCILCKMEAHEIAQIPAIVLGRYNKIRPSLLRIGSRYKGNVLTNEDLETISDDLFAWIVKCERSKTPYDSNKDITDFLKGMMIRFCIRQFAVKLKQMKDANKMTDAERIYNFNLVRDIVDKIRPEK